MFKLALSAGHYMGTAGKRCLKSLDPNETREWYLNDRIADKVENLLSKYNGIEILRLDDTTGKTDVSLSTRSNKANSWKADFYLAIHHNAGINGGSGGGITAYIYNGTVPQSTINWQKDLYNALIAKTGLKGNRSNGCPRSNLHECREPYMDAVLLELGFMDSSTDIKYILTDTFATQCAEAITEVIVKKAGLTKKASNSGTTSGSVKEYKVVKEINRYSTAADAAAQKNAKSDKLAVGTYYIYNKYPNGVNGMYNISTDKTGASAGSWINPAENVKQTTTTTTTQKLYRVRKSKDDAKSQVGAYSILDNAKEACDKAGAGYKVFDWDYKVVYEYKAPTTTQPTQPTQPEEKPVETPKEEVKVTAVYDLNYPEKNLIVDKAISRTEKDCVKAITKILSNNSGFNVNIAKAFWKLAPKYNIDPIMAIAQSILETGWFKYAGSAVKAEQHNYCGLGVTSNGIEGGKFDTIEDGVTAQLQHLFAYGCKDALNETIIDPRFKYVTRGIAPYWQQLAGRWACPGYDKNTYDTPEKAMAANNTYGQKIRALYNQIIGVIVTDADVEKHFPKEKPVETPVEKPDDKPVEAVPPTDVVDTPTVETPTEEQKTNKIVEIVIEVLKKLLEALVDIFRKGTK